MTNWKKYKLEDIGYLVKDGFLPNGDENLHYIGLEHINQGTYTLNGIGTSDIVESNKYRFKKKDILFGKLRPYFKKVFYSTFDGICSTDIWVIRAKEGIEQRYLFYLVASNEFVDLAVAGSNGTKMPRADWNHLKDSIWNIPPLPEQRAIASVLSSLDDKIELNRRQNETLEKIAQAIFRHWFVDFNFPCQSPLNLPEGRLQQTLERKELPRVLNSANKAMYPMLEENAKEMRINPTPAEAMLWEELKKKKLGFKFRRQHVIDCFIVDFYCIEKGLVIEIDGGIHKKQKEQDKDREEILKSLGCQILRFNNNQVMSDINSVLTTIKSVLTKNNEKSPLGDLGAGAGYKDSGGEMVESELGLIPKGWRVGKIKDLADKIQYGFTASSTPNITGYKFLRITDIQGGIINWDTVPYCEIEDDEILKYRINDGDIFIARTGASTGENAIVLSPPSSIFASYLIRIHCEKIENSIFLSRVIRSNSYNEYIRNALGGSAQPNANAQVLTNMEIVIPGTNQISYFNKIVEPLIRKIRYNQIQNQTLSQLRDELLPKLMSGKVRVKMI